MTDIDQASVDVRPLLDEMLNVARQGVDRAGWKLGAHDDELLLPIIGALTVFFGERLGVTKKAATEKLIREQVAQEIRAAASQHQEGTSRRRALLEAARIAEQGQAA